MNINIDDDVFVCESNILKVALLLLVVLLVVVVVLI